MKRSEIFIKNQINNKFSDDNMYSSHVGIDFKEMGKALSYMISKNMELK